MKRYVRFEKRNEGITLHRLRRYSLNRFAKANLLVTQQIAGHKDPKTTLHYTKRKLITCAGSTPTDRAAVAAHVRYEWEWWHWWQRDEHVLHVQPAGRCGAAPGRLGQCEGLRAVPSPRPPAAQCRSRGPTPPQECQAASCGAAERSRLNRAYFAV